MRWDVQRFLISAFLSSLLLLLGGRVRALGHHLQHGKSVTHSG